MKARKLINNSLERASQVKIKSKYQNLKKN